MKLFRHGLPGSEKPGIIVGTQRLDVSAHVHDYNEAFFESGGLAKLREIAATKVQELPHVNLDTRLGAAVARPSKIVCIGLNYRDHALETGAKIPVEPILFFKSTTALCGPNDPLIIPKNSEKTDWETELAIIIGKKASYVSEADANDYIAGYCMMNDYSERAFQKERGGQFCKGKSCDSFAPLGPMLVTPDELGDVHRLTMRLSVNGRVFQDGNTSDMIFNVPFIVHYISQFMTLLPGDVISTGTPAGVGLGVKPEPVFLRAGDVVEMEIAGLGNARQVAVNYQ